MAIPLAQSCADLLIFCPLEIRNSKSVLGVSFEKSAVTRQTCNPYWSLYCIHIFAFADTFLFILRFKCIFVYFILLFLELQYTICPYDTSRFFFPVHILFYMVFLSEINLDDDDDDVCLFTVYCIYAFAAFLRMIFLKKTVNFRPSFRWRILKLK